jgi:hypothetical protein
MGTPILALVVILAVSAPGIDEMAAARAAQTASGECTAKGARVTRGSRTTTTYNVELNGVTCAFAKPWVTRLSSMQVDPSSGEIPGGPPGWYCQRAGRPEPRAQVGSCSHSLATKSVFFAWEPSFATSSVECTAKGAPVRLKGHGTSTTYGIFALHGVTCAFAKRWVTRLSYRLVNPTTRRISGGPSGWICYGAGSEKHATTGDCATPNATRQFHWDARFRIKS